MDQRIARALEFADRYGSIDGGHHKMWVIDQMVRALLGCPVEQKHAADCNGVPYVYRAQGENDAYRKFAGVTWDAGVTP